MNCDDLINELCNWIYSYTFSNDDETDALVKFAYEMQKEINRLGFEYTVAEGKSAVTYCGKTDNGWVFKDFQTWTKDNSFSYAYISNTEAGKILNSGEVETALKEIVGKDNYQAILWGTVMV